METEIVNITKIKDGFFLGDEATAVNLDVIIQFKITHMINAAGPQIKNAWESIGIKYLTLNWDESPSQNLFDVKDEIANRIVGFIDDSAKNGEGFLVHSVKGQNRACLVVLIYFIRKFRWSLKKALEFLSSKKSDINIPNYFLSQLNSYEARLCKIGQGPKSNTWNEISIGNSNDIDNEEVLIRNTYLNSLVTTSVEDLIAMKNNDVKRHTGRKMIWSDQTEKRSIIVLNTKKDLLLQTQKEMKPIISHKRMKPTKGCLKTDNKSKLTSNNNLVGISSLGSNINNIKGEDINNINNINPINTRTSNDMNNNYNSLMNTNNINYNSYNNISDKLKSQDSHINHHYAPHNHSFLRDNSIKKKEFNDINNSLKTNINTKSSINNNTMNNYELRSLGLNTYTNDYNMNKPGFTNNLASNYNTKGNFNTNNNNENTNLVDVKNINTQQPVVSFINKNNENSNVNNKQSFLNNNNKNNVIDDNQFNMTSKFGVLNNNAYHSNKNSNNFDDKQNNTNDALIKSNSIKSINTYSTKLGSSNNQNSNKSNSRPSSSHNREPRGNSLGPETNNNNTYYGKQDPYTGLYRPSSVDTRSKNNNSNIIINNQYQNIINNNVNNIIIQQPEEIRKIIGDNKPPQRGVNNPISNNPSENTMDATFGKSGYSNTNNEAKINSNSNLLKNNLTYNSKNTKIEKSKDNQRILNNNYFANNNSNRFIPTNYTGGYSSNIMNINTIKNKNDSSSNVIKIGGYNKNDYNKFRDGGGNDFKNSSIKVPSSSGLYSNNSTFKKNNSNTYKKATVSFYYIILYYYFK